MRPSGHIFLQVLKLLIIFSIISSTVDARTANNIESSDSKNALVQELDYDETCRADYDCENGAKCDRSECVCLPKTSGARCENIDCARINPACEESGGQCQYNVLEQKPFCECPEMTFLNASSGRCEENCKMDYDCENGANCFRSECVCLPKTSGAKCENIDCAKINPACEESGGQCHYDVIEEKPFCDCPEMTFLNASSGKCEENCEKDYDCENGARCDRSECVCLPNTSGRKCESIDCGKISPACEDSGGQCKFDVLQYMPVCECPEMKFFNSSSGKCEENCEKDYDCENGAKCVRSECVCLPHTSGTKCENIDCGKINPACEESGGKCEFDVLQHRPVCECPEINFLNTSSGRCEENCKKDYDCENGAKCVRSECVCLPNTSGKRCENIDCGKINPACEESGGKCQYNVIEKKPFCECPEMKFSNASSGRCEENCKKDYDCANGAKCVRSECVCLPNTSGTRCENIDCGKINPACEDSGGQCQFNVLQYKPVCKCPEMKFLDASSGKCEACDCGEHGKCKFSNGVKTCVCDSGFIETAGECQDPCTPNPCQKGGMCFAVEDAFRCSCVTPFSGDTCETDTGKMKIVIWILLAVVAASILTNGIVIYRNRKYQQRMEEMSLINCPLGILGNDLYGD